MDSIKEKEFHRLVEVFKKTNKFSDKIKMHTYAIDECKMYMTKPMLEKDLLTEVIKLENEVEGLEGRLSEIYNYIENVTPSFANIQHIQNIVTRVS